MMIKLNGQEKEVRAGTTVSDLLAELQIKPERVAVELNLSILERGDYPKTRLNDGDRVEVIGFIGGGSAWREVSG